MIVPHCYGKFVEDIKRKLCADKGYIRQALFENLFLNGSQLDTKVKSNMENSLMSIADKILLRKRALIEVPDVPAHYHVTELQFLARNISE